MTNSLGFLNLFGEALEASKAAGANGEASTIIHDPDDLIAAKLAAGNFILDPVERAICAAAAGNFVEIIIFDADPNEKIILVERLDGIYTGDIQAGGHFAGAVKFCEALGRLIRHLMF